MLCIIENFKSLCQEVHEQEITEQERLIGCELLDLLNNPPPLFDWGHLVLSLFKSTKVQDLLIFGDIFAQAPVTLSDETHESVLPNEHNHPVEAIIGDKTVIQQGIEITVKNSLYNCNKRMLLINVFDVFGDIIICKYAYQFEMVSADRSGFCNFNLWTKKQPFKLCGAFLWTPFDLVDLTYPQDQAYIHFAEFVYSLSSREFTCSQGDKNKLYLPVYDDDDQKCLVCSDGSVSYHC